MGNYLNKPKQIESCNPKDLQDALVKMGTFYSKYSSLVAEHGITGAQLTSLRSPSRFEEFLLERGCQNPLHRIVLTSRIRASDEDDSPRHLVELLQAMGPEYNAAYGPAVADHCVGIDMLAKLKLISWKTFFEGVRMTNILHQNQFYNQILDAASERAKARKKQEENPPDLLTNTTDKGQPAPTKAAAVLAAPTRRSSRTLLPTDTLRF